MIYIFRAVQSTASSIQAKLPARHINSGKMSGKTHQLRQNARQDVSLIGLPARRALAPLPTALTSSGPLSAVAIQDTVVHSTEPLARRTRLVGTHPPNSQVLARKVCKSRDLGKLAGRAKGWLVYQDLGEQPTGCC